MEYPLPQQPRRRSMRERIRRRVRILALLARQRYQLAIEHEIQAGTLAPDGIELWAPSDQA